MLYRVQAARWIFFCRPDSIHVEPSEGELQTLVNALRNFAVSGAWCTGFAADLISHMPTSICYASVPHSRAEPRLRAVGIATFTQTQLVYIGKPGYGFAAVPE